MFKDKKFLKEIAIILIVGIIVNASCFLMCSITGHCATSIPLDTTEPPFVVMNNTDLSYFLNGSFDYETFVNQVKSQYNLSNSDFIICTNGASLRSYSGHWCALINIYDNVSYYGNVLQVNDITESRLSFQYNGKAENVYYDLVTGQIVGKWGTSPDVSWSSTSGSISLLGDCSTSQYQNGLYYFTSFYPVYVNNTIFLYDGTSPILSQSTYIVPGDFTELPPLEEILNDITNSFTPHSNTTPPSYDSTISDGENITNSIDSLGENINDALNSLGSNIKGWFDNLQKKLTDTTNAILGGIHDGFATLNQNFKDFFGAKLDDIIDKLAYFQEPFSSQELADNLNNANFSSDFLGLITTVGSFSTAFTSGSEPNSCSFTLDFSNSYYDFGVCEFSLDWILPFRSTIRLIVGCLCVYSLIVSIFTSLNTYIGGTSSINDDI